MEIAALVEKLSLKILCGEDNLNRSIESVYCSDMLSRVLGGASKDAVLITVQTHMNTIAVASLLELACIIFPEGLEAEQDVLENSTKMGIPVLSSRLTAYELAGKLYGMGIGQNENSC